MRTALRLGTLASLTALGIWASLAATGCTVTVNDAPLDAGPEASVTDTGTPIDTGTAVETGIADVATDTAVPPKPAVIIPAKDLIGGASDDIRDFGGGSTRADIELGGRVAYAVGKYAPASGSPIESTVVGKDATDTLINGRLEGLPTGAEISFTVTAYLRGLNGNNADTPNLRIPWAQATCKATPSATADVTAVCPKLALIPTLAGIVFTSDVLPDGYCETKGNVLVGGKPEFEGLRARTPLTGTAVVSKWGTDCEGVIWVPLSEFQAQETNGVSNWALSAEVQKSATACTMQAPGCVVDRKIAAGGMNDIMVIGDGCRLSNANTGGTCF